jgi:integrase
MARTRGKLRAVWVERVKAGVEAGKPQAPGMHFDGGGLYLQVTERGASWIYRYATLDGRRGRTREMGLGSLSLYGLAEARALALDARQLRHQGIDPIDHRNAARTQARLDEAKSITFKACAEQYIASHRDGWRNAKHAAQWETTLATYAYPIIGALPVATIDTKLVMKVLDPIWKQKPETASRLRGRIELIIGWATTREYRTGDNPARWRGHLENLLPALSKVRKVEHHAALPYVELPGFMSALCEREGIAARALEFTILTAGRVGEVLGARWSEFNLLEKTWTVPAERMKARKEHRVPLSDRALAILQEMQTHRSEEGFVFPGARTGAALSDWSIRELVTDGTTVHGFRSTFRDWADERTHYSNHVVEQALAHAIGSKVEKAYRRSDLFDQRRRLMDEWSRFSTTAPAERGEVVPLRA